MPKPKGIPAYKLHKASGQARVIIDGRHIYLGVYGSTMSHEAYARVIAEYLQRTSRQTPVEQRTKAPNSNLSINELILDYVSFAKACNVQDGAPTKEVAGIKDALQPLRELFGRE